VLYSLLKQAIHISGNVWECGVYKGGTAAMMAAMLRDKMPMQPDSAGLSIFLQERTLNCPTGVPRRAAATGSLDGRDA